MDGWMDGIREELTDGTIDWEKEQKRRKMIRLCRYLSITGGAGLRDHRETRRNIVFARNARMAFPLFT